MVLKVVFSGLDRLRVRSPRNGTCGNIREYSRFKAEKGWLTWFPDNNWAKLRGLPAQTSTNRTSRSYIAARCFFPYRGGEVFAVASQKVQLDVRCIELVRCLESKPHTLQKSWINRSLSCFFVSRKNNMSTATTAGTRRTKEISRTTSTRTITQEWQALAKNFSKEKATTHQTSVANRASTANCRFQTSPNFGFAQGKKKKNQKTKKNFRGQRLRTSTQKTRNNPGTS